MAVRNVEVMTAVHREVAAASVSQPDAAKLLVEVSRLAQIWGMEPSAQIWADLGFRETRNPWLPRFGELYEAAVFPSEIALRQVLAGGVPKPQNGVADGRQRRGVGNLRVAEHGMEAAIPYPRDRGVDLGGIEVIQDCLDIAMATPYPLTGAARGTTDAF
jgi:hypothetical protein